MLFLGLYPVLSGQTLNQTLYLDFGKSDGTNGNMTVGEDVNGNYWNNIVSSETGSPSTKPAGYKVNLVNSTNAATGFVLETTEDFRANGRNNGALKEPDATLLGDLAVATATEDYFFIETNQNDKGAFVLKGLNPEKAYKFYIFGSREGTDNRTAIFSISGTNGSHGTHQTTGAGIGTKTPNTNDNHVFESGYVLPKTNGEILFEVGILSGGFAYINAMKIEEYEGYVLPEAEKTIYIDFGKNNNGLDGSPTTSPDANDNYWNNMYSNGDGPTTEQAGKSLELIYSDNTPSGYIVELGTNFEFNGIRNGGLTNPDPDLLGDLAVATATHDYLFRNGDGIEGKLFFKNLNPQKMYRFHLFGSRYEASANRIGFIKFIGSNTITGIHQMGGKDMAGTGVHQNISNVFVSDLLVADSDGTITLELKEWLGNFFHVNLIKIEEITANNFATSLSISGANAVDKCGTSLQLTIKAYPEGAFCPAVTWSVDDETKARISKSGTLYPLSNGTITVTASATFSEENVIKATKTIIISGQSVENYSLTVMGSSIPYGQGANSGKGYAQLWASWLAENAENAWSTTNISIPGNNTTDVLNRWYSDLLPACDHYVYYGLSLGNEGVHETGQVAFDSYRDNMQLLIKMARDYGKIPLIGNNYARADFNTSDYYYVKQLNLLIHEWDVPSVNLLGAIDNGKGQWATGYQADNAHPNTAGHAEMFYAFVPSLLDALAAGKPQPQRMEGTTLTLGTDDNKMRAVTWTPEGTLHAFTLTFSFRTTSTGTIASFTNQDGTTVRLLLDTTGKLTCERSDATSIMTTTTSLNDGQWHTISLTHYYAWGRIFLYVDGTQQAGNVGTERYEPKTFSLNSIDNAPGTIDYSELYFHRAGMTSEEIKALHSGRMLKSSLEIYAPLDGTATSETEKLINLAQSLNTLAIQEKDVDMSALNEITLGQELENMKKGILYTVAGQRIKSLSAKSLENTMDGLQSGVYVLNWIDMSGKNRQQKLVIK